MYKTNHYRTISVQKCPPHIKIKHLKTIFSTEDAPYIQIKHSRTTITTENTCVKRKHSNIHFKDICIIVQGHNGFWTENTSSRTYEYIISKDTTVQDISTSSRTYAYLISISFLQCLLYTNGIHTSTATEAGIASPADHREDTSRQLLHTVPSSHKSWDHFFTLARGGGTNRLPRGPSHTAVKSLTECPVKKTKDTGEVKSMKIWTFHINIFVTIVM